MIFIEFKAQLVQRWPFCGSVAVAAYSEAANDELRFQRLRYFCDHTSRCVRDSVFVVAKLRSADARLLREILLCKSRELSRSSYLLSEFLLPRTHCLYIDN